ncbi:MAG: hypothetical protein ACRDRK_08015 [Pseudonocardia sp.]
MSAGRAERTNVLTLREDRDTGAPANVTVSEVTEALAIAHQVAVLAETDPAAPLIVATRAALEVADARHAARRDRRVAGWEVHGGDSARWARWADQRMPYAKLAALRATPGTTAHDGETGDQAGTGADIDGGAR